MSKPSSPPVRLLLVDDSELVRAGLRALLSAVPEIDIVGEAGTAAAAVQVCQRCQPDVVLLDIRLPDGTGFDVCRQILKRLPDTRVLILTSVVDDALLDEAIRAGTHGYLLKEINGRGLVQAIRDVHAGKSILDPAVTARVIQLVKDGSSATQDVLAKLSPQEGKILALIPDGLTNKEIAARMGLAEKTVKNYLSTIFEKLQVSRRAQAATLYTQQQQPRH